MSEIDQHRSAIAVVNTDSTLELLQTLIKEVAELKLERQSRNNNQSGRFRPRSRSWQQPKDGLCFYHTNFKQKAKKYVETCKFFGEFKNKSVN